nr:replication-associated protein [Avon-Heathcote Estuary associated circular virus 11]AJP36400.1 replication-associated protein [Avon-Heathcote Estuary associated circular virus 11]AJP36401.1 replication-associated protein [Avon-Heathcote Estuary associated circular virus 11]
MIAHNRAFFTISITGLKGMCDIIFFLFLSLAQMASPKKYNRMIFTINNPGPNRPQFLEQHMAYMIYVLEEGDQTHTPHLQGYIRWKCRKTFKSAERLLGGRAYLEIARGTEEENQAYCKKEEGVLEPWQEFGTYDGGSGIKGRRTDLEAVAKRVREGASARTIAVEHTEEFIRYHAGIERAVYMARPEPPAQRQIEMMIIWGPSGIGKTHAVMMNDGLSESGGVYCVPTGNHPWDQYEGEATIFMDEFRWEHWECTLMNRILDKWRLQLPCRYMNKMAAWTRIIICTNQDPMTWYPNEELPIRDALRRRLGTNCRHMTERGQDLAASPPSPDFSSYIPPAMRVQDSLDDATVPASDS